MRSNRRLARALEAALSTSPSIRRVRANPVSGSLLVVFDPDVDVGTVEAEVHAHLAELERTAAGDGEPYRAPLVRVLDTALPGWPAIARPVLLTAGAHSLNMLQGLALITSVNVAGGEPIGLLRKVGIETVRSQLTAVTATSFALTFAEVWAQHLRGKSWRRLARTTEHRLRTRTFGHLEEQDLEFFDKYGTGQLLNVLTGNVESVGTLTENMDGLIESTITVLVAGVSLLRASPGLAVIAAAALPIVIIPARLMGRNAETRFAQRSDAIARLNGALENILSGIVEVKSFTAEDQEATRVNRLSQQVADTSVSASSAALLQSAVVQNILYLSAALAIGYGARLVAGGKMPHARLIPAVYWIPLMMRAFGWAAHSSASYYAATSASERICGVLEAKPTIRSGPHRLDPHTVRGDISFERVTFAYEVGRPVLNDVSLHIPAGTSLGIVGPNGSGKTTLLWLLLRFYEPQSGRILLDGQPIQDLEIASLRRAISLVDQEGYLFDDTLQHNVRYGRPEATDEEVRMALAFGGGGVLGRGREDMTVRVGERGHRLSGGQRQLVALARALLKGAPVLALDEATSQLDYETEAAVKERLRDATAGKSVIHIAHRLSSVRDADNIAVLEGGTIVEQGNHESLLERRGVYRRLWDLQR